MKHEHKKALIASILTGLGLLIIVSLESIIDKLLLLIF
jgi:hypothetical protein